MSFQQLILELVKANSFKAGTSLVGAFLFLQILPIAQFIAIAGLLVTSDWVTGVWAAYKRHERITSKGLRRTVEKILMYSLAIFITMVVEVAFFSSHYVVAAVALYICLVELYSNLENISSITNTNIIGVVKEVVAVRFPWVGRMLRKHDPADDEGPARP